MEGHVDLRAVDNFGAVDADADELLRDCFQDHPAYNSAKSLSRFLILGRKGSGKTAIYKRLITPQDPLHLAIGHSLDDYPWHHHDLQAQSGVPEERRYIHSWKFLVLMGLARLLLNNDQSQPWSDEAAEALSSVEDFVIDSYGSRSPDFSQLFSPHRQLHFKGSLKLKLLEVTGERLAVKELPTHIQEVNRAMQEHIINGLNPDISYYVCFDQLDLGFTKSDEKFDDRIVGLILAARDLVLAARAIGRHLNVVVFLRDDIYQDLRFEDKNKITENYVATVRWNEAGGDLTLRRLMESRFSRVLADSPDSKIAWDDVFDETKEMPGRQSKYKHICDRTFLRPRDMIRFCNTVLGTYKRLSGNTTPSGLKFDNAAVHSARDEYSNYLLNELDDEIAKHVPRYRDYLEVLKELGSVQFDLKHFEEAWTRRQDWNGITAVEALAQLFEFSVIGYLKPGGRGGGSEYVWRYQDSRARFNGSADLFRVHFGFKEALDLTRSSLADRDEVDLSHAKDSVTFF